MRTMFRRSLSALCVLGALVALAPAAMAADHLDSPAAQADPAADINDLYVFRSTDSENLDAVPRTVLVMTVSPLADDTTRFSDAVSYEFVAVDLDTSTEYVISCVATDAAGEQIVTCTAPDGIITDVTTFGDETDGTRAAGGVDIISFAGLRDDPFFFDLEDFQTVYGSGDPSELVDDTGTDFFAGANTLAIVVDVKNSVFGGATNLGVWARTVRQGN